MKKIVAAIVLLVLGVVLLIASVANLSRFSAYLIGKAMESSVTVGDTDLSLKGSTLSVKLSNVQFAGKTDGNVQDCRVTFRMSKGAYIEDIVISNFEISVGETSGPGNPFEYMRRFTYPIKSITIKNGVISVPNQKVIVDFIEARNLNLDEEASVNVLARAEELGTIHIIGRGEYNKSSVDLKGNVSFQSLGLSRIYSALKGSAEGSGSFRLCKDRFDFTGKTEVKRFSMKETWLKRSVDLDRIAADVAFSAVGENAIINIENAFFKKTPFKLAIVFENYTYSSLELTSEFLNVQDVISYATSDYSLREVWDVLKGGQVKADKLLHKRNGDITANLTAKDLSALYNDMQFANISGEVSLNNSRAEIVNLKGEYKKSRFYDAKATIPYGKEKPISVRGRYMAQLTDIPWIIDLKGLGFEAGTADGVAEVQSKGGRILQTKGSGTLRDARAIWKNTSFVADGSFKFSDSAISFDRLQIKKDKTSIICKAKINNDKLDALIKGTFEPKQLGNFVALPFETGGTVELDGEFHMDNDMLQASGAIDMDGLIVNIPGYMKKEAGARSSAYIKFSAQGSNIIVDNLAYNLENIDVRGRGTISEHKVNASIQADAPDLARVGNLFLLPEDMTAGSISLDVSVKDLEFPIKKIPSMNGNLRVNNGFIRVPGIPNPFRGVNLVADFRGDSATVQLNGLTSGGSRLNKGTLTLDNLEKPSISANFDMARFNPTDFFAAGGEKFRLPKLTQDGIFFRSSGEMIFRSNEFVLRNVTAKNVLVRTSLTNGMISIPSITMGLFEGEATMNGSLDLTGVSPKLSISGAMSRLQSDLVLAALGSTSKDLTGTASVNGNLASEGKTLKELISHLSGSVSMYNRNGVIKRWNILSKIFGALNVYDLLRGKVDFGLSGLPFSKLGAEFTGSKGVFHTDNFLLDSSSMILTGQGDLNLNDRQVQGSVQVSPLIVIDRTLSQIPLLRDIIKEPNQGFLYVTYSVRGPVTDPVVTPDVVSTIGGKAIEILRNILVFPREVFQ